jgi:DNA replication protein DnaC
MKRAWAAIKKSNLEKAIETYTFDNYKTTEQWQSKIKVLAEQFATDNNGRWFFIGGQDGSGKTHICTAIVGRLFEQRIPVHHMMWLDASSQLKANTTEAEDYQDLILPLKNADVLYIDDLFKTGDRIDERGKKPTYPTSADIRLAFELLNYRYSSDKTTIISSQRCLREIIKIDSAIGGRIYERAGDYCIDIKGVNRNYRINK